MEGVLASLLSGLVKYLDAECVLAYRRGDRTPKVLRDRARWLIDQEHIDELADADGVQGFLLLMRSGMAYAPHMHGVLVSLYRRGVLPADRTTLQEIDWRFPDVIPETVWKYEGDVFAIASRPSGVAAYLLGLPIHQVVPSRVQVEEILAAIGVDGLKSYQTERLVSASISKNDTNVYFEPIADFFEFDVVFEEGTVFAFTRGEWGFLLSKGVNPYTNEKLSSSCIDEMERRQRISAELYLPPSVPFEGVM